MGRKRNPDNTRGYRRRGFCSLCPVCGKTTNRGIHKKCEGKEPLYRQMQDLKRRQRLQETQDARHWNHPEAAEQKAQILKRYGERPQNVKDWWTS